MHCMHVARTCAMYGQYARDLTTRVHEDTFMVAFMFGILQFRVVLLLVANRDKILLTLCM